MELSPCDECDGIILSTAIYSSALQAHIFEDHLDHRPFVCRTCSTAFSSMLQAQSHTAKDHPNEQNNILRQVQKIKMRQMIKIIKACMKRNEHGILAKSSTKAEEPVKEGACSPSLHFTTYCEIDLTSDNDEEKDSKGEGHGTELKIDNNDTFLSTIKVANFNSVVIANPDSDMISNGVTTITTCIRNELDKYPDACALCLGNRTNPVEVPREYYGKEDIDEHILFHYSSLPPSCVRPNPDYWVPEYSRMAMLCFPHYTASIKMIGGKRSTRTPAKVGAGERNEVEEEEEDPPKKKSSKCVQHQNGGKSIAKTPVFDNMGLPIKKKRGRPCKKRVEPVRPVNMLETSAERDMQFEKECIQCKEWITKGFIEVHVQHHLHKELGMVPYRCYMCRQYFFDYKLADEHVMMEHGLLPNSEKLVTNGYMSKYNQYLKVCFPN